MKTKIIKIGSSQGIRLPKLLLNQIGAEKEVHLNIEGDRIIIKPIKEKRQGWAEAFHEMAGRGDDKLLDVDTIQSTNTWDEEEWVWQGK